MIFSKLSNSDHRDKSDQQLINHSKQAHTFRESGNVRRTRTDTERKRQNLQWKGK